MTVCAECLHAIEFDDVFGWLHQDFGPDGRSFRHRAAPMVEPAEIDQPTESPAPTKNGRSDQEGTTT